MSGQHAVNVLRDVIVIICVLAILCGCAGLRSNMRRHPLIYGVAIGAGIGATIGIIQHCSCPSRINGYPYQGTCPCPKYWPPDEPGPKH